MGKYLGSSFEMILNIYLFIINTEQANYLLKYKIITVCVK